MKNNPVAGSNVYTISAGEIYGCVDGEEISFIGGKDSYFAYLLCFTYDGLSMIKFDKTVRISDKDVKYSMSAIYPEASISFGGNVKVFYYDNEYLACFDGSVNVF